LLIDEISSCYRAMATKKALENQKKRYNATIKELEEYKMQQNKKYDAYMKKLD